MRVSRQKVTARTSRRATLAMPADAADRPGPRPAAGRRCQPARPARARAGPEPGGLELGDDRGGRGPFPRLLGETARHDRLEDGGHLRVPLPERLGAFVEDRVDHPLPLAAKGAPAGEHLVEHHAQRPEVGGGADAQPLELLGRHVGGGAHRDPLLGEGAGVDPAGEAEVEELHPAVREHHDVLRLEVPVDDAGGMGGGESRGELAGDRRRLGACEAPVRPPGEELGERRAVVVGHGEKTLALVLADLVDGPDVRMVQGGRGLGLAAEAGLVGRARIAPLTEELEGDLPTQLDVLGEIDDAHAAAAEGAEQPVVGDLGELPDRDGLQSGDGSGRARRGHCRRLACRAS